MGERTDLEAAEKKVSNAWWAALFSAGVTVIFAFISLGGEPVAGIDAWAFLDVALLLGLAFGVSRKSRSCAVLLLVYFVGGKILMWTEAGNVRGLPVALVFMWYFAQGVVGTFQYHGLVGSGREAPGAAYRPAGGSGGTPWLVWMILASVLLVGTGGAWYFKSTRQIEQSTAERIATQDDVQTAATTSVGRLNSVEMNGSTSPLSAAIVVDERTALAPCRGITPGAHLFVRMASRDIQAKLETVEQAGVCKLTLKEGGSWPLQKAIAAPKVGDAVFAASFEPDGKVLVSRGEVRKVTQGTQGVVIETSARKGSPVEGSPILDTTGRVLAIAIEGQDTALPAAWSTNWPER
jgi:hypothetical protein